MMYDDEMLDAARASERAEIGAQVDSALDELMERPVMQGETCQLTIEMVRERLNEIFVYVESDDD